MVTLRDFDYDEIVDVLRRLDDISDKYGELNVKYDSILMLWDCNERLREEVSCVCHKKRLNFRF